MFSATYFIFQEFRFNRIFKLLVQGFGHYGGASGQVGISASEAQPARPNCETKMWTIFTFITNFFCAIVNLLHLTD